MWPKSDIKKFIDFYVERARLLDIVLEFCWIFCSYLKYEKFPTLNMRRKGSFCTGNKASSSDFFALKLDGKL